MSLREKLRRAFAVPATAAASEAPPAAGPEALAAASSVREQLVRRMVRLASRRTAVALPEGREITNARGSCYLRRLVFAAGERHGNATLGAAPPPDRALFLDTETTGLAGGAGTVVFLTGLAFFEEQQLVLEQVFLRAFAEEAAALQHVAERVAAADRLITFVGKSFDRHRLAARFAVQRVAAAVLEKPHLDLYYVARRAHKATLPNVKLRTVVRALLGLERADDLPGSEAPAAFLDWVRDRSGAIDRVFEHNRLDVLSLVVLLGVLGDPAL